MPADKLRGTCETCGNTPRVLTKIESGQLLCRTCLREIRDPRAKYVCREAVESLRSKGFDVPNQVTKEEYRRLSDQYVRDWQTKEIRAAGKAVADDIPLSDLERLHRILRLQEKGIQVSDSASPEEIELKESLRAYYNKVVGVSHENRDGTSRQEIISRCRQWEELRFTPEPDNPDDEFAVAVCRRNGEQIGYLNQNLGVIVSGCIERGWRYFPLIKTILDDGEAGHYRGVALLVIAAAPTVPAETIRDFVRDEVAKAKGDLLERAAQRPAPPVTCGQSIPIVLPPPIDRGGEPAQLSPAAEKGLLARFFSLFRRGN